jgi:UDP-GlcNAc:undecaprenyl-phosphate GlcNAc-1-phosphate transferase
LIFSDHEVMESYLCVYLGSAFSALVTTPVVIFLAGKINAVDLPGTRNIHLRPTPRIGGVAIFTSTISLMLAVLLLDNTMGAAFHNVLPKVIVLLSGSAFVFVVGLIDDIRCLPARIKLLAEMAAATAVCAAGVRIMSVNVADLFTLRLGWLSWPLTMLWIVGITNAVNLSDGLDGLAAGISAITCAVIAVFAVYSGQVVVAILMLALLGSLTGFLFFNFNPAKVFMGDCGSLFLGFVISAASVASLAKPAPSAGSGQALSAVEGSATFVGLALPILALGIPIFDTLLSMLRRFLERRSLFSPDRSHFHHRLLGLGLDQRHVVVTIYLATLLFASLGLIMLVRQDISSLFVFGCVLLLIVLLFRIVGAIRLRETLSGLQKKYMLTQRQKQEKATFDRLQLQFRQVRNFDQCWFAICEAAQQMDFVWVCLKTSYQDGHIDTTVWRTPSVIPPPAQGQSPLEREEHGGNLSHIVTVTLPFGNGQPGVSRELELAIWANGSLEAAGHRAMLFSRLIDEHKTVVLPAST